jgi:porin
MSKSQPRRPQRWASLLALILAMGAPWAAAAPSLAEEVEASESAKETIDNTPQPWLQNWLDMPDWMAISLGYVNEINGNPSGGLQQTATYTHNISLNTSYSSGYTRPVDQWGEFDHWKLVANLSQRSGTSLSQKIPNALAVQQIFGYGQTFRLAGLWVERGQQESGLLTLKLGKMATFDDFASSPLYCYYTNNGFCGQIWGIPNSLPVAAYPANQYGAVVHVGDRKRGTLRYGLYQINPEGFEPGYHGADFQISSSNGLAQFLQLDIPFAPAGTIPLKWMADGRLQRVPEDEKDLDYVSGLPAPGLQLGGWLGSWDFPLLENSALTASQNNGVYGLVAVPLTLGGLALDGRLWANLAYGFNPDVQTIPVNYAGGWVGKGVFRNRPNDALVIGFSHAGWSPDMPTPQVWESVIELGYQVAIGTNASIQPNLQYVFNPSGTGAVPDAFVLGVQMTLLF